ncbi:MAG: GDSL-type esterase/lipase family protein [bacterium]|nr:GDSL-type esterase/lipase family protein [bacterium]
MSKWVSAWGTATSIAERREGNYAKNLTLRYAFKCTLDGSKIRVRFSNICGNDDVRITKAFAAVYKGNTEIDTEKMNEITFNGLTEGIIPAGGEVTSDEIEFRCVKGADIAVSMYFEGMTELMSTVYTEGPCQDNYFADGDLAASAEFPLENRMPTGYTYFLNTVDVLADDAAKSIILFGDSITAQSWADRLNLKFIENNDNIAGIRRGVSGTRVLGQYDCLQYAHYGLSGENRFVRECNCAGADTVVIFHGINDIIHPDGVNPFRPMSNFPSLDDMVEGFRYYIREARKMGLKVVMTTILPIEGWRTYEEWREGLRVKVNEWIRTSDEIDGYIDFDKAVCDPSNPKALKAEYDSGDHLHPSGDGAQQLAEACYRLMIKMR